MRAGANVPSYDVAIYTPNADALYERDPRPTGGAELQTVMLARELARSGMRVAHIVFPVAAASQGIHERVHLVERPHPRGPRGHIRRALEVREVWRALAAADAAVIIVRIGSAALGVAAAYARARGRSLVFATASNMDLTMEVVANSRSRRAMYSFGVRSSDAMVVQTGEQAALARAAFPSGPRVETIPSFAEAAAPASRPEAFLWAGRLTTEKQPLAYLELARQLPEARFRMVAGATVQTPPGLEQQVRGQAKALANFELLPALPRSETMKLMDRAVACVSTSPVEGMPNVFLEAWARGIPVLALQHDPDGCIRRHGLGVAADGSPGAFVDGARRLWEGRDAREDVARRATSYVAQHHSASAVATGWLALLDELRRARQPVGAASGPRGLSDTETRSKKTDVDGRLH